MTTLLTLNTGSSSVKYALFKMGEASPDKIDSGTIKNVTGDDHASALADILARITTAHNGHDITYVAHRIVHGGAFASPAMVIDNDLISRLEMLAPCAPLHQPYNLAAITQINHLMPQAIQFACCDTAFHSGHDPLYDTYALPQMLRDKGIRKYGFHGISYCGLSEALKREYPDLHRGRIVAAHLGNGASVCAMRGGTSIDSSMGFTALDGLVMGTRCGAIDAGAILYMMHTLGMNARDVEHTLYNQSGLLGLSGISNDVKTLLESASPDSALALDVFCLKAAQFMAMMAISMGGVDAFVFTGGIGENAPLIRTRIMNKLSVFGAKPVLVIPADEEQTMADLVYKVIHHHA